MDKKNIVLGLLWINTLQASYGPNARADVGKRAPRSGTLRPMAKGATGQIMGIPDQNLTNSNRNPNGTAPGLTQKNAGVQPINAQEQELMAKLKAVTNNLKKKYYGDPSAPTNIAKAFAAIDDIIKNSPPNLRQKIQNYAIQIKATLEMQGCLARMKKNASTISATQNEMTTCTEIETVTDRYKNSTQSPALVSWILACAEKIKAQAKIQAILQMFLSGQYGDPALAANLGTACAAIDNVINAVSPKLSARDSQQLKEFGYEHKSIIRLEAIFKRFSKGGYGAPEDPQSSQNAKTDITAIANQLDIIGSPKLKNKVTQSATQVQTAIQLYEKVSVIEKKLSKGGYGDPKSPLTGQNVEKDLILIDGQISKMPATRWISTAKKKIAELRTKLNPQQTEATKAGV
ncbi:MAG: hypothetical protein LBJ13_00295 [Puniceicoccales bacterium]|jgi:hypothetical protein|nr:hypothetical protein [Puniceicoccales bacterium]